MNNNVRIEWPEWHTIINESFIPLIDNKDRYLILYGGRGSSKSDFAAKKLIYRMLTEKYVRFILIRNNYNSIRDTQYQNLKDIIYTLGLESLFEFKLNPLEIACKNGNTILARGCDDVLKLKSIKDPTGAWYEEDIVSESDFITITTSIRTSQADYLQEIFSINPEVTDGDHSLNWFWKRFFEGKDLLSYSDVVKVEVKPGLFTSLSYTVHHSTYKDNKWITPQFVGMLEDLKRTNPYYYTVYTLGRWGNKITGGQFYKLFSLSKNIAPTKYNASLPLWLSFDFNVNPGCSCPIFQVEGKKLMCIDEIQLPSPRNTTLDVCKEVVRRYQGHVAGMFVTGDPAGKHEDTRSEKGFNDYVIIQGALQQFRPSIRMHMSAPPVVMRANFINTIFEKGYNGIEIVIGDKCTKMIADLLYLLEASDGTKSKTKVKDTNTGVTYERYGHFSDALDYCVTQIFDSEFRTYQRGGRVGINSTWGRNDPTKSKYWYK